MGVINKIEGITMGQDKNAENEYRTGYGGYGRYTTPQQPGDASSGQQGGQSGQGGTQQSSQQQGYQQPSYGQQFQQQEYADSTYQAPGSAAPTMSAFGPTTTPLSARVEAILSYALWWVGGLAFFLIERKNRFVRFHAAQSIIFFGVVSVLLAVLQLISIIPLLGFLLSVPISFASTIITIIAVVTWLFMMVQMYRGKNVRIPIVSGYAESLLDRFTSKKKKSTI
jgi:uncharacterized membrane protein